MRKLLQDFIEQNKSWEEFIKTKPVESTNASLKKINEILALNGLIQERTLESGDKVLTPFVYSIDNINHIIRILDDTAVLYTEEFVYNEVSSLLDQLRADKEIVFLGELFEDKPYTRNRFGDWFRKFKDNKEIVRMAETIKETLETRAATGLMKGKYNAAGTIFHLKNNFKWVDKQEIESINKNLDIDIASLSDEELARILDK